MKEQKGLEVKPNKGSLNEVLSRKKRRLRGHMKQSSNTGWANKIQEAEVPKGELQEEIKRTFLIVKAIKQ